MRQETRPSGSRFCKNERKHRDFAVFLVDRQFESTSKSDHIIKRN